MSPNPRQIIEELLTTSGPAELSATEEAMVLEAVEARYAARPTLSPFTHLFTFTSHPMIPIVLMFALLFGAGGTVAASDGARPGDLLFPIDRVVEDVRLSLASEEGKNELRIKFANERLGEFEDIADDDFDDELSGTLTSAEADIFTNETIVKLEAGDRTAVFSTSADSREEIVDAIRARYAFSSADIEAVLEIETEDRASRTEDGVASLDARERLERALDTLNDFVQKNREAASTSPGVLTALEVIESRLLERSASFPEEIRVKVRDDRARYEVRGENGERVRVEIKDGEIRIKSDDHGDDRDDDEDDDRDDDSRTGTSTPSGFLEIEADIFTDITTVKVELNDRTTSFTTSADTREEIIDEIQDRFPALSESEISAALQLETEDRASRADDLDDSDDDQEDERDEDGDDDSSGHGSDDDSDDSDDNEDDDEDEDDDSSGRGSGGGDDDDEDDN